LDIHEYQAKQLLAGYRVPMAAGSLARTSDEAAQAARDLGGDAWVVKAQVHAGARGKAGGIRLCRSEQEVRSAAESLLGTKLVTLQTGPAGKIVGSVYIEKAAQIEREIYLAVLMDRSIQRPVVIASAAGGVEIEQAKGEILREVIEPAVGMQPFQARELAFGLKLTPAQLKSAVPAIIGIAEAFLELDASLIEVNPLVVTAGDAVLALDCKMSFDSNALHRQPKIVQLRDWDQEDPREFDADKYGVAYISLEGDIGCIVNGAGLAMATMDLIKHAGAEPANFLDIGGGASPERVANAFRLVMSDPRVKVILVNIFAGINRCDWVAEGIVQATRDLNLSVPVVVRLAGTHLAEGQKILKESGLAIISADELGDAAEKAVAALAAAPAGIPV
jgi:malate-CoA ligase subunit beta